MLLRAFIILFSEKKQKCANNSLHFCIDEFYIWYILQILIYSDPGKTLIGQNFPLHNEIFSRDFLWETLFLLTLFFEKPKPLCYVHTQCLIRSIHLRKCRKCKNKSKISILIAKCCWFRYLIFVNTHCVFSCLCEKFIYTEAIYHSSYLSFW